MKDSDPDPVLWVGSGSDQSQRRIKMKKIVKISLLQYIKKMTTNQFMGVHLGKPQKLVKLSGPALTELYSARNF